MAHIGVNSNDTGDKCQVCVRKGHLLRDINIVETGYEGGGRRRELWRRQTAARNQLSATLKEISAVARERRWKSGRRGGGGGDMDAEESENGSGRYGYRDSGTDTVDAQMGK